MAPVRNRSSAVVVTPREIHGIVFGSMGKPTHVLVPGYRDPKPEHFATWLEDLRVEGWEVTLTPALSFEGVLVDARPPAGRPA